VGGWIRSIRSFPFDEPQHFLIRHVLELSDTVCRPFMGLLRGLEGTKPFGIDELFARVRAALRRASSSGSTQATTVLEVGVFRADLESRHVTVEGREIHLTPKEFDLLTYFMRNAGKVLTHRTLLKAIWGGNYVDQNEYLRVFVGQLRKKVEPEGTKPRYILTEPWVGYRFEPGTPSL